MKLPVNTIVLLLIAIAIPRNALAGGVPTFCFIGLNMSQSAGDDSGRDAAARSASTSVSDARDQLHRISTDIERQFEASAECGDARHAMVQSYINFRFAEQGALARVRLSPEGVASQIEIDRLEEKLSTAREQAKLAGRQETPEIDSIALELLHERSEKSHREADAMAADPKFVAARYAWLDASASMAMIQQRFTNRVRYDEQWKAARTQLDQQQAALASISH